MFRKNNNYKLAQYTSILCLCVIVSKIQLILKQWYKDKKKCQAIFINAEGQMKFPFSYVQNINYDILAKFFF